MTKHVLLKSIVYKSSRFIQAFLSKKARPRRMAGPRCVLCVDAGLHFREFLISFVAQLGIAFRGDKEFFGLLGDGLHLRVVAHLAHDGSCGS